jgi:alpha-ketoglutarate-dependent taurine dioxygenase
MPQEQADILLDDIFDHHLVRPEWEYRHVWEAGDLVMWDNRCVLHAGTPGRAPDTRRPIWRISIMPS